MDPVLCDGGAFGIGSLGVAFPFSPKAIRKVRLYKNGTLAVCDLCDLGGDSRDGAMDASVFVFAAGVLSARENLYEEEFFGDAGYLFCTLLF